MHRTFIKPFAKDVSKFVLDTLFPISCISCGQEGEFVCSFCKLQLAKIETQHCIICQKPTPFGMTHAGCLTPHGADGLISFFDYHDDKAAKIIIHGKYYFLPDIYKILGQMMAEKIKISHQHLLNAQNLCLCPVPLHSRRKRWRGFNQAEILSRSLAEHFSLPCVDALVRCKPTKTQKDLKKEARMKNVDGAFKLKQGADVHGKKLILVDDVTTTGSTLLEAAKILKRNGAATVWCLTIARD